jgi:RNA polymerase sigma factor (sigma-70 family)
VAHEKETNESGNGGSGWSSRNSRRESSAELRGGGGMPGDSPDFVAPQTGTVEQDRPGGKERANPEDGTARTGPGHGEGQNGALCELADEELLRRLQVSCDELAFQVLYRRHTSRLIHMLTFSYSLDEQDARDIVQETWLYLSRKIRHLACPCNVVALLQQAARHGALNFLRKQRRCELWEPGEFDAFEGQSAVCRSLIIGDFWDEVKSCVTPAEYNLLILRYVECCDYAQVARQEGVPVGTVKQRLHRVRKKLAASKDFLNLFLV